jgi:hypothetical protein
MAEAGTKEGVCRRCAGRYGDAWRAMLEEQIPWANRQAQHVLKAAPTCGLLLEDVQSVAWHATYRSIQKFDPSIGAPFQQFALRYVQQMIWTRVRAALQKRMKEAAYVATFTPADMVHHDKVAEICAVDSPLALACQWLQHEERRLLGAFLSGKPVDEALLRPILQQLRADLAGYGAECADDVLLGSLG